VLVSILILAVGFAALVGLGVLLGFHRTLRERFPDEPQVALLVRTGDTVLGLLEQVVLFALIVFLVLVTSMWFSGDQPTAMRIFYALIAIGSVVGIVRDRANLWGYVTLLGVAIVFGGGAFWVAGTGKPFEGADYDVRYACFLLAMVGGAFAAHHRRLLSMDFVSHFLPGGVKPWTRLLSTSFATVIAGVFVKYGYRIYVSQTAERHTRGAQQHWMPESTANAAMLIGATLLFIHLFVQIVIDVDYLVRRKHPPEPQMGAA
jgi:TRAP-type C4-dicarboxylate transport system permease small subunit